MPRTANRSRSKPSEHTNNVISLGRVSQPVYPVRKDGKALIDVLLKVDVNGESPSRQGVTTGRQEHPFDMRAVTDFQTSNIYHSSCIHTKVATTVGLGFKNEKLDELLNPLCKISWQDVFNDAIEDYYQTGNGYIEVVRTGGQITGLHHIPAWQVYVHVEDALYNYHYEIISGEAAGERRFPAFGDTEDFRRRRGTADPGSMIVEEPVEGEERTSEVIHFRRPTSLSRWYGFPDWLPCVPTIQLVQAVIQHNFDFFNNRGVPEFFLFLLGSKISKENWKKIESALKAQIGRGNAHKSCAVNIEDSELKVQLEKLAVEGKTDGMFSEFCDTLALQIVSAHRVPPLLAGIQTPGKLGATNELPNALMAFQILVIGPAQKTLRTILDTTLGNKQFNGGLAPGDFEFKKITEEMNLDVMATVGGMRDNVPEAQAKGRNLEAGLKD